MGMFHCSVCGCMVIAGMPHGACVLNPECPYFDEEEERRMDEQFAIEFGEDSTHGDSHPMAMTETQMQRDAGIGEDSTP